MKEEASSLDWAEKTGIFPIFKSNHGEIPTHKYNQQDLCAQIIGITILESDFTPFYSKIEMTTVNYGKT